jgi:hypothetical protein
MYNHFNQCFPSPHPINMPSNMPDFPLSFGTSFGMLTTVRHAPDLVCDITGIRTAKNLSALSEN